MKKFMIVFILVALALGSGIMISKYFINQMEYKAKIKTDIIAKEKQIKREKQAKQTRETAEQLEITKKIKQTNFIVMKKCYRGPRLVFSIATSQPLNKFSQKDLFAIVSTLVKRNSNEYIVRVFFYNKGEIPGQDIPGCLYDWTIEDNNIKLKYDRRYEDYYIENKTKNNSR